jgi:hypothetical protein
MAPRHGRHRYGVADGSHGITMAEVVDDLVGFAKCRSRAATYSARHPHMGLWPRGGYS